ncbi:hypothetical protein [Serratia sp. OS31]|uniref:hypothetical protein n=1 Tax=Serratia sp. OS31 TaxID=2760844 RepID=UPI0015FFEE5B|nr:hypothetical protein [Serratia sp. OS31]MBB1585187.1 hypothetical protein [Serratia sp. OS31]
MKKKVETYALFVCFLCVFVFMISLGTMSYSIVKIFRPELTIPSYVYEKYQTNDLFWSNLTSEHNGEVKQEQEKRPSNEELTTQRTNELKISIKSEYRSGFQLFIQSFIYVLTSGLIWLSHIFLVRSSRKNDSDSISQDRI